MTCLGPMDSLFRLAGLGVAMAFTWSMTDENTKIDVVELGVPCFIYQYRDTVGHGAFRN